MSSRPLIGITTDTENGKDGTEAALYVLKRSYVDRVLEAGGVPLLIPPGTPVEDVAPLLDGWLIPGGDDINPSLWGDELHPEASLSYLGRYAVEEKLFKLLPPEAPILGICYGCQLLNVFHGGSLHQHIPEFLGHDQHRGDTWQKYEVESETLLGKVIASPEAEGKSWHHQAINRLGEGLRITARHEDGTIEGVESTTRPWMIGVQWHPERSEGSEATPRIFAAFIEQAREYRRRRSA